MQNDCALCAYAVPAPTRGEGTFDCRRNPPVAGRFAETHAGLWCGEFAARPAPAVADALAADAARIAPARDAAPAKAATAPKKAPAASPKKGRGK